MSSSKQRATDGLMKEGTFGTMEERILIRLNGPPPGYKSYYKLLVHALQQTYGLNYNDKFYVHSSMFKTMSKVLDMIYEGKHDPG